MPRLRHWVQQSFTANMGEQPEIQISGTRVPTAIDEILASVTVLYGKDLRERGASDVRSALRDDAIGVG